ncbi:MAG: YihY/virulence factor BrkB family protein [Bacteroidia bacterium]|nr:YihY/virulence factor BrkB family protein [Bacteroidia bacterium]
MMRKSIKKHSSILKDTFNEFFEDNILKLSAALAYYTVFSLPAMIVVIVGLCSIFYKKEVIRGEIFSEMSTFIGKDMAIELEKILKMTTIYHDNFLAAAVGLAALLFAASGMFGEIQDSINTIWGLKAKPKKGFVKLVLNRLISFAMVLVLGFMLTVSLLLNALLEGFFHRLEVLFSEEVVSLIYIADHLVMILVTALLIASILKVLPDAKIQWRDVWAGSVTTCVLFMLGKFLIGYYLSHSASVSAYGAAGSIILVLLWVYYSAIILYFGAEFTQVYARHHNRKIQPNKYAVWVEKNTVEKQLNTQINEHTTELKNKHKINSSLRQE